MDDKQRKIVHDLERHLATQIKTVCSDHVDTIERIGLDNRHKTASTASVLFMLLGELIGLGTTMPCMEAGEELARVITAIRAGKVVEMMRKADGKS